MCFAKLIQCYVFVLSERLVTLSAEADQRRLDEVAREWARLRRTASADGPSLGIPRCNHEPLHDHDQAERGQYPAK